MNKTHTRAPAGEPPARGEEETKQAESAPRLSPSRTLLIDAAFDRFRTKLADMDHAIGAGDSDRYGASYQAKRDYTAAILTLAYVMSDANADLTETLSGLTTAVESTN